MFTAIAAIICDLLPFIGSSLVSLGAVLAIFVLGGISDYVVVISHVFVLKPKKQAVIKNDFLFGCTDFIGYGCFISL